MNVDIERVRTVYAARDESPRADVYSLFNAAALLEYQHRARALVDALRDTGYTELSRARILDVGCGTGQWLVDFETLGADRAKLSGIDAVPERVRRAANRLHGADIREGDAATMPWADGTFDLVFQATMLSSIPDRDVRKKVAAEMIRVTAPDGTIISYDFTWNNPRNPDVRGITRRELSSLFDGFTVTARSVTLAPPISRKVAPFSMKLASILEWTRVLNTHCLSSLRRTK